METINELNEKRAIRADQADRVLQRLASVLNDYLSAKLGRFCPYYALNLFRKLVDSTRTIYNIPTAIYSSMEIVTYYFGFTCYFLAVCLVGVGYQLSTCYLPAIYLFRVGYLLVAYLFGLSGLSI